MQNPLTPDEWTQLQTVAEQYQRPSGASTIPLHPDVDPLLTGQRLSHLRPVAQALVADMLARKAVS